MVNGKKVNDVLSDPVDDSVAADEDFPDVLDSQFWNNPPRARIVCQAVSGAEHAIGERRGHMRGIPSYKQANGLEIVGRLGCPPYFSHFAMRCRTSSGLRSSPRSACSRPRWTL